MSAEALAIALHHSKARGTAKLVLLGIANHDGDGGAWPSVRTLAKYANVDERTVQRAIDALVKLHEVKRIEQGGGTAATPGHLRPNLYHFLLECPPYCDHSRQHRDSRPSARYVPRYLDGIEPVALASPGDTGATPPVTLASPPPVTSVSPELDLRTTTGITGTELDAGARVETAVPTADAWSALIDLAHGGRGIVTADLPRMPKCTTRRSMPCSINPSTHLCLDCGQAETPWAQPTAAAQAVAS